MVTITDRKLALGGLKENIELNTVVKKNVCFKVIAPYLLILITTFK